MQEADIMAIKSVLVGKYNYRITGTVWDDRITGAAGNDTIYGGAGNDTLTGSAGRDVVYGGAGNDLLYGGTGADYLSGGLGSDAFIFNTRPSGDGLAEMDIVQDYTRSDLVVFDNDAFAGLGATGWLAAQMFKVVGFGGVVDADDRLIYNGKTGVLTYDANGSGAGGRTVIADFAGNPALTADHIFIV
jgi:Ca2+-binding RTX toxin-like protein